MSYIGNALQGFGNSVQGLGETIYVADADRKYNEEALAIAQDIDAFTKGLYTDPDHGVPGSTVTDEAGYMGKWDEFSKQIQERVDKVANPLAKKNLGEYWGQAALEQKSRVFDVQYKSWASDTVSAEERIILETIRTGGARGQDAFEFAERRLTTLRDRNLISDEELQTRMASLSQVIIRKGLTDEAKAIHAEKGLAAALKFIADDVLEYTGAMRTFMAGDEVKALVESDIKAYHALEQDEIDSEVEKMWSYYTLSEDAKKGITPLTHDIIEDTKLDQDRKVYWHDRLFGFERGDKGSQTDLSIARNIIGTLEYMKYARQSAGATGSTPFVKFFNPVTGKYSTHEASPEGAEKMVQDYAAALAGAGQMGQATGILMDIKNPNNGAYGIAIDTISAIKDPGMKIRAMEYINNQQALYPDASKDDVLKFLEIAKSEKMVSELVRGRFNSPTTFSQDEDRIAQGLQDGDFQFHIGGDPQKGISAPISYQSKAALESHAVASQREIEEAEIAEGRTVDWSKNPMYWMPNPALGVGNYLPGSTFTRKDGSKTTYTSVLVLTQNGKREAGLLRQDFSTNSGDVKSMLQDPETKKFYAIDPRKSLQRDGWALPAAVKDDKDVAISEAAKAAQVRKNIVSSWPSEAKIYSAPPGFSERRWNTEANGLEAKRYWYYDNGYTWNGTKFIKAAK